MNEIIHWNSQSIQPKIEALKHMIQQRQPLAITINDHRLQDELKLHNYKCFHFNNNLIAVRQGVPTQPSSLQYHAEGQLTLQNIGLHVNQIKISLINVYRWPTMMDQKHWEVFEDLIFKTKQISSYIVIVGDFNAPIRTSIRNSVNLIIRSQNLRLLNTNQLSTHNRGNELDLCMVSNTNIVHSLEVDSQNRLLLHSDHRPLIIKLSIETNDRRNQTTFIDPTEEQLKAYKTTLDSILDDSIDEIDALYAHIVDSTRYAAILNFKVKYTSKIKKLKKSKIFLELVKKIHHAWNRIQHGHTNERIRYDELKQQLNQVRLEEKRKHFADLVQDIETNTWTNATKNIITKSTQTIRRLPDSVINSRTQQAPSSLQASLNNLCQHFASTNTENNKECYKQYEQANRHQLSELKHKNQRMLAIQQGPLDQDIETEEVKQVLDKQRKTARGPDEVEWFMLRHYTPKLLSMIHKLYSKMWANARIPQQLKQARIAPIHKSGQQELAENYRPISITSIIMRLFEKVVKARLLKRDTLHRFQAGFRPHHSTCHHLMKLTETINEARQRNIMLPVVYLDIKSAFDRLPLTMIINSLIRHGLTGRFLRFVNEFLTNRTIYVEANNEKSHTFKTYAGVPQGSVIAPLLFNYFIDSLCRVIDKQAEGALFADDIIIMPKLDVNINVMTRQLQETLDQVTVWSMINKVEFSQAKTQYMLFNGQTYQRKIPLLLNDFHIQRTKKYKYLGIIFHETGSFQHHFKQVKKKTNWMNYTISRLTQPLSNQIITLPTLRTIVSATVKAILSYGLCFIEYTQKQMEQLDSQIAKSFRRVLNLPPTTGTKSLLVETQILPVQEFQQQLSFNLARSIYLNCENNASAYNLFR